MFLEFFHRYRVLAFFIRRRLLFLFSGVLLPDLGSNTLLTQYNLNPMLFFKSDLIQNTQKPICCFALSFYFNLISGEEKKLELNGNAFMVGSCVGLNPSKQFSIRLLSLIWKVRSECLETVRCQMRVKAFHAKSAFVQMPTTENFQHGSEANFSTLCTFVVSFDQGINSNWLFHCAQHMASCGSTCAKCIWSECKINYHELLTVIAGNFLVLYRLTMTHVYRHKCLWLWISNCLMIISSTWKTIKLYQNSMTVEAF